MGRKSEGWAIRKDARTGIYTVRFQIAGERFHRSTRQTDIAQAKVVAARLYQQATSGRIGRRPNGGRKALDVLMSEWLVNIESTISEFTARTYEGYCGKHLLPFFMEVDQITPARIEDYMRNRLRSVKRATVCKELAALRSLIKYGTARGHMDPIADFENPSPRTIGTEHDQGKRRKIRIDLSPETVEAILEALPEETRAGHPSKAFFTVMWETALRKGSLFRLRIPKHYRKGDKELRITRDIDKARYQRELPISRRAQRCLESVAPDEGYIFPKFGYKYALTQACLKAGLSKNEALHVSPHDFRHARITQAAGATTDLAALKEFAGHTSVATTAKYVHANKHAVNDVLAALDAGKSRIVDTKLDTNVERSSKGDA